MTLKSLYPGDAPFVKSAVGYAQQGQPVFPLRPHDKMPLIPKRRGGNGFHDATVNTQQVQAWWERKPTANIGGRPPVGVVVVDLDPEDVKPEGRDFYNTILEITTSAPTLTARTGGGGVHYWYLSDRQLKGWRSAGTDIKQYDTGYVVLPPSIHPNGQAYEWLSDAPLAPCPDSLIELLTSRRDTKQGGTSPDLTIDFPDLSQFETFQPTAIYWLGRALVKAGSMDRNPAGHWLAQQLHWNLFSETEATAILVEYAVEVNKLYPKDHAYTVTEARASVSSAWQQGMRSPTYFVGLSTQPTLLDLPSSLMRISSNSNSWEDKAMEADSLPSQGDLRGRTSPAQRRRKAQQAVVVEVLASVFGVEMSVKDKRLQQWFTWVSQHPDGIGYESTAIIRMVLQARQRIPQDTYPVAYLDTLIRTATGHPKRPACKAKIRGSISQPISDDPTAN